jgi:predicted phosphodiesterase
MVDLVTQPFLQLTSNSSAMVVEFITHKNPRIKIEVNGLFAKKVENVALKTDDMELQKWVIDGLKPNQDFKYTLVQGLQRLDFVGHTPRDSKGTSRLAIFGDSGSGLPEQKQLAEKLEAYNPDLIVHVGDVAYPYGQESSFLSNHFPVYGNTLARTPMVAAAGNHDTTYRDYAEYPGCLAYYKFFNIPKNYYPWARDVGNYSFNYGSAFWLILDSNTYNNWTDPRAQAWVKTELAKGAKATWRFVAFHHAPWHASPTHAEDTQMRALDPLFKQAKVQAVFSGHVHNYQRSKPDAAGPYYIVSGAGGGGLYDQNIAADKKLWKPYTQAYAAGYSYTSFEYDQKVATLKQISLDGSIVDTLKLSSASVPTTPSKTTKPVVKPPAKKTTGTKKKGG